MLFLTDFKQNWNIKNPTHQLSLICPVGVELFHRTGGTNMSLFFRGFARTSLIWDCVASISGLHWFWLINTPATTAVIGVSSACYLT